jgi:Uma2 family endonuclease
MKVAESKLAEPTTKRWTREQYYHLAAEGWFQGQRVQLIKGEIIQMPPQGHPHYRSIFLISEALRAVFAGEAFVRTQAPLNALEDSDPEPDVAVIPGTIDDFNDHPVTALLVVEVADSSLRLDRRKAGLYAAAGVPEYWIADVNRKQIEVYRNPVKDAAAEFGAAYAPPETFAEGQTISPQSKPDVKLDVVKLF